MHEPICPSECPSMRVMVTGLAFQLCDLTWGGAKGTRTPGLLHAMNLFRHSLTRSYVG
jgi:hypothetical protein